MPPVSDAPKDIRLSQDVVIKNLKKYFKYNHLPFKITSEGLCNGLASVYAKYALENRESRFFEILKYISSGNSAVEVELASDDLNNFIKDVLTSYNPQIQDSSLSIMRSMEVLTIDGQPAKSSYDLSFVTSDAHWSQIISELDLVENEVAKVCSTNHAVAMRKNATGDYTLYDPNYAEGFKLFKDEMSLVNELHHRIFKYKPGNMALSISIIRAPNAPHKEIPDQSVFINRYITADSIKDIAQQSKGMVIQSLTFAAKFDDVVTIETLLKLNPDKDDILKAAIQAARHNCVEVFKTLLPLLSTKEKSALYLTAVQHGRKDIFTVLQNQDEAYSIMMRMFLTTDIGADSFLHTAAASGSPELIQHILADADTILTDDLITAKILSKSKDGEDCITKAIKSGSVKSVNDLMIQAHEDLTPLNKLHYLMQAIKDNQASVVEHLIQRVPEEYLSGIHMNMPAVEQTQVLILKILTDHGVTFGAKESIKINTLLDSSFKVDLGTRFSILLADVKQWFASTFGNVQQYMADYVKPAFEIKEKNISTLFKEQMSELRAAEPQNEVNLSSSVAIEEDEKITLKK